MLSQFQTYVKKEKLFGASDKILLTVSGGIDSVVMCDLFYKAGLNFGIAHCNFQLRGKESDEDELFVEALAEKTGVIFHSVKFDTNVYSKKNKLSIQVAARQLRYQWFEEIRGQFGYDYVATAHHRDDSIETFFINLIRGTSISGLHGILPKNNHIIRPMLFCTKDEIANYTKSNKLKYREDSSNASDKYVRNKIRHQIIPVLKEINPQFEGAINNTISHLREVELVYKRDIETNRKKIVKRDNGQTIIYTKLLKKTAIPAAYLYEFLKPFNFNEITVKKIIVSLDATSGKQFFSTTHRLIKDREVLIVDKIESEKQNKRIQVKKQTKNVSHEGLNLTFNSKLKSNLKEIKKANTIAQLDFDKLAFPLEIRKWQKGDVFHPLGMKGKKKLSDFFIDQKLSISQKENTWLLTSKDKIVWVIGQRIDERFKVNEKTDKIYIAELV